MPPKKKTPTTTTDATEDTGGAFRWTLENERKLLVLTQGRYLSGEDYERLVAVFPGTNLNGVKIKCSRFRVEQRNLYEQLGWTLPDGGAVKKTPAKRAAEGVGEEGTPTKKPRAPRAKKGKKDEVVKSGEDGVEPENEGTARVKEEQVEPENEGTAHVKEELVEDESA